MKSLLRWSLLSFSLIAGLEAGPAEDYKKAQMIADLGTIKHTLEVGYAPLEWKKEYKNWDLNQAYEYSKQRVLNTPSINTKKFQKIVRDFIHSCSDYHVGVHFCSTEQASLPFSVKPVNGRYFIDWIDALKLPPSYYALRIGDEITTFDGVSVSEIIAELANASGYCSNSLTDAASAAMKLTHRAGYFGDDVPSGALIVNGISAKTHREYSYQLMWAYRPEQVSDPFDMVQDLKTFAYFNHSITPTTPKTQILMSSPIHLEWAKNQAGHNGGLGAHKSFIPALGTKTWSNEASTMSLLYPVEEESSASSYHSLQTPSFWYAYTYTHAESNLNIGYIRIPHFMGSRRQIREFEDLIKHMEESTDALVLDQVNNPGGYVEFVYQLASYLTNKPLVTPLHRIKITQDQVLEAYEKLEMIRIAEMIFNQPEGQRDSSEEQELEELPIYYSNYLHLLFTKRYYEFILSEWKAGQLLTKPTAISGVDRINPHPKYTYSKPILMLINELDFSGADFLPAILQDNKRVTLFGTRTAGAGGYVFRFQFPNNQGIDYFSYTASIAERIDSKKIENLGVTPDIDYQVTVEDIQNHYQCYVKAVNQAVKQLVISSSLNEEIDLKKNKDLDVTPAAEYQVTVSDFEDD
jgi:PDZ domain/Peptidase family S41